MEGLRMLNLTIGLAGLVLCGLGILQVIVGAKADKGTERFFLLFYACLILFAGSNLAGQLLRGRPGQAVHTGLVLSNFLEFSSSCLLVYIVSKYLIFLIDPDRERRRVRRWMTGLLLAHLLLLFTSQFTGFYYVVGPDNVYRRSAGYPLSYLFTAVLMLLDVYLLLHDRNRLTKKEYTAFWLYVVVTAAAMVLQLFIYGIYYIVLATIVAALIMYIFILSDLTERYERQVEENARLKIDILLAQIQPHFLFNSLTVIKAVCRTDPKQAEAAIDSFAEYLRHNMDSLSMDRPIPFSSELEHVRRYLELQQLRFRDMLTVEYDLETTDLTLPALTLQPLVENAVTYGVRKSDTGIGTVTIRSREYPDRYEISVIDTGPGFVPEQIPGDTARSHIGLQNVRERLRRVCGGELNITSVIGQGTTAVIVLTKGKETGDAPC